MSTTFHWYQSLTDTSHIQSLATEASLNLPPRYSPLTDWTLEKQTGSLSLTSRFETFPLVARINVNSHYEEEETAAVEVSQHVIDLNQSV